MRPSNGAVIWLKLSLLLEEVDVCLGGGHGGGGGLVGALLGIVVLGGYDFLLKEVLPADGGDAGYFEVGFCLVERALGLPQLLLDVGGIDDGKKLALFYVIADIDVPFAKVAIGAGVEGGRLVCIDGPGQDKGDGIRVAVYGLDAYDRLGVGLGELILGLHGSDVPPDPHDDEGGEDGHGNERSPDGDGF